MGMGMKSRIYLTLLIPLEANVFSFAFMHVNANKVARISNLIGKESAVPLILDVKLMHNGFSYGGD